MVDRYFSFSCTVWHNGLIFQSLFDLIFCFDSINNLPWQPVLCCAVSRAVLFCGLTHPGILSGLGLRSAVKPCDCSSPVVEQTEDFSHAPVNTGDLAGIGHTHTVRSVCWQTLSHTHSHTCMYVHTTTHAHALNRNRNHTNIYTCTHTQTQTHTMLMLPIGLWLVTVSWFSLLISTHRLI